MSELVLQWQSALRTLLTQYEARRGPLWPFVLKLYLFFTAVNAGCYWLGLLVAYPEKMVGPDRVHYFVLQFPVGLLGAIFDAASFFVTVYVVRRALQAKSTVEYVLHLAIDVAIAIVATFWVLLVFSVSGWILSHIEAQPELLAARNAEYEERLVSALQHPRANWRNLYFGLVMGVSASLPTLAHLVLFLRSCLRRLIPNRFQPLGS